MAVHLRSPNGEPSLYCDQCQSVAPLDDGQAVDAQLAVFQADHDAGACEPGAAVS
ncbi:MAG: hypothetical protein LC789_00405 [Actinobacteria bacterium]|nr:hypothetical protein [Actinomycetota bacterium]MCA1719682.1 hypothetical protein [Actinomycetota bacterium]